MTEASIEVLNPNDVPNDFVIIDLQAAASDIEYLTTQEIADILKVSTETVTRKFQNRKGVIDLGSQESRFTRRYRILRIPLHVFEAYLAEIGVQ
jgi:hypothetical protein